MTTTCVITYTYSSATIRTGSPLNRLTSAAYSTGEQFEYAYDAKQPPVAGNRTAMTSTTGTTTYEYDAANRLTSVDGVPYTWDARGNLVSDSTFTYAYNSAGRVVRAESVTATLVYTYNAQRLRVAQSVDGDASTYAWDWASGLPEMLSEGGNLYLVGHDTLGRWDGATWAYHLPDALGSVRQETDGTGAVVSSREWTPFGIEVGAGQAGLGYTGEWWDADVGLQYLRARWYDGQVGGFTSKDPFPVMNRWLYADANPANRVDPSGYFSQYTIARSLGASNFDEVIRMFREEHQLLLSGGGRWGFLRLLQEAKSGNTLKGLFVGAFGMSEIQPIGLGQQFRCVGGEIWVGQECLQSLLGRMDELDYGGDVTVMGWRDTLQGYYLNSEAFRDGYRTSLPDYATAYFSVDILEPFIVAGVGLGIDIGYIVDRYGRAYISIGGSVGAGVSPLAVGYSESYVNPWKGTSRVATLEELDEIIPRWSSSGAVNIGLVSFAGELNWDEITLERWVGSVGIVAVQLGINIGLVEFAFEALPPSWSVNPDGWYGVESLPRYEEKDIPLQWDSEGCGC